MQAKQNTRTYEAFRRHRRAGQVNLLLIGSEDAFKNQASKRLIQGAHLSVVARSSSLLEAIACLESKAIDLVVLSREYREEELKLFTFDARRRGFAGLILQPADMPGPAPGVKEEDDQPIQVGDFFIETSARRVWIRGSETQCKPKEFELLRFLCRHPDELLSYRALLEKLWGDPAASRQNLRGLIRDVRARIETTENPRYILTHRQFGYRFVPSPNPLP